MNNKDLIEKIRKQTTKYFKENSDKQKFQDIILKQAEMQKIELQNEHVIIDYYSAMTECLINIIEDLEEGEKNEQ